MKAKKKKFIRPDAEVIDFSNEDIITLSGQGDEVEQAFNRGEDENYGG